MCHISQNSSAAMVSSQPPSPKGAKGTKLKPKPKPKRIFERAKVRPCYFGKNVSYQKKNAMKAHTGTLLRVLLQTEFFQTAPQYGATLISPESAVYGSEDRINAVTGLTKNWSTLATRRFTNNVTLDLLSVLLGADHFQLLIKRVAEKQGAKKYPRVMLDAKGQAIPSEEVFMKQIFVEHILHLGKKAREAYDARPERRTNLSEAMFLWLRYVTEADASLSVSDLYSRLSAEFHGDGGCKLANDVSSHLHRLGDYLRAAKPLSFRRNKLAVSDEREKNGEYRVLGLDMWAFMRVFGVKSIFTGSAAPAVLHTAAGAGCTVSVASLRKTGLVQVANTGKTNKTGKKIVFSDGDDVRFVRSNLLKFDRVHKIYSRRGALSAEEEGAKLSSETPPCVRAALKSQLGLLDFLASMNGTMFVDQADMDGSDVLPVKQFDVLMPDIGKLLSNPELNLALELVKDVGEAVAQQLYSHTVA